MGQTASSFGIKSSSWRSGSVAGAPPLLFHPVHGDNIQLSDDGRCARRIRSYCHGILFSGRPVAVGERVVIQLVDVSAQWSGAVRLGFTNVDPLQLKEGLPKYSCPDLCRRPGVWAKAVSERLASAGRLLAFSVSAAGEVRLSADGAGRGVFITGVDTSAPLWAIVDLYGNATALRIVNPPPAKASRRSPEPPSPEPSALIPPTRGSLWEAEISPDPGWTAGEPPDPAWPEGEPADLAGSPEDRPGRERFLSTQSEWDDRQEAEQEDAEEMLRLTPAPIHPRVYGGTVTISPSGTDASRAPAIPTLNPDPPNTPPANNLVSTPFGTPCTVPILPAASTPASRRDPPGFVFCRSPLRVGERLQLRLLATGEPRAAGLTLGLTSCDPEALGAAALPPDPELLGDRPEYWPAVSEALAWPLAGERVTVWLEPGGEVRLARDRAPPRTLMFVDVSLPLWPVLGLTGAVRAIRVLGVQKHAASPEVAISTFTSLTSHPSTNRPETLTVPQESYSTGTASDCSVCLDRACDAALYGCGHVCMCFPCAQAWRARGTGRCPLCCAPIKDVIRLFLS